MPSPPPGHVEVAVAGAALGVDPQAEIAGTVVAAGDAAGEWLGRRVIVPRILPCGDCQACRRGRVAHCQMRAPRPGLGERETVPARWLCSVEPPAALAPFTALARAGVGPGDHVIIVGGDARAHFAAAIVAAKGAAVTIDSGDPVGGRRAGAFILATGGVLADRRRALELAGDGATVVLLDAPEAEVDADIETDWSRLVRAEVRVLGVVGGHPDLLPELCALVVRGQLPLAAAVRAVPLAGAAVEHQTYVTRGGTLPIAVPATV